MIPQRTQDMLRLMACNSGWSEVGGRVIREPSPFCTGGDAIGRTVWVGKPEWARGAGSVKRLTATVEKAIAGAKRMGKQQQLIIDAMLAEIGDAEEEERTQWQDAQACGEYESKGPELPALAALPVPGRTRSTFRGGNRPHRTQRGYMDYITASQFAEKHCVSARLVLRWIADGRIAGAIRPARDWLIPSKAKRPEAAAPYGLKKAP